MSNVKSQLTYKILSLGTGMLAAAASGVIAKSAWKAFRNDAPPANPENPDTEWKDAVIWTVATALAAGITRILIMRGANESWRALTGELPKEVEFA